MNSWVILFIDHDGFLHLQFGIKLHYTAQKMEVFQLKISADLVYWRNS